MEGFEFEMGVVVDFLGSNWQAFLDCCADHDIDEARAEEISNKLDQVAGRG